MKRGILEQAKTLAQLNTENCPLVYHALCKSCLAQCEFEGTPTFRGKWVSVDAVLAELDKAIVEIEKKAFRQGVGYWENAVMLADVRKILLGVVEAEQK